MLALAASVIMLSGVAITALASPASADPPTPPAPTNVGVDAASLVSVNVSFTGDGDPLAQYTVTCSSSVTGALAPVTGASSPILVAGLQNLASQTVTCQVAETSGLGVAGPCSASASLDLQGMSGEGSCRSALSAPTNLSVAPGEMSATVSWAPVSPPDPDGGDCLQGYVVTPSGSGSPIEVLGHGTTTVIYGLTDGATVTFTVAGANGGGIWPASVSTPPITIGAPAAPHVTTVARVAKGAVKVSFNAPADNGAAIKGYGARCQSSNGGAARATIGRAGPFTVKRLTAGKTYTCTVLAANSRGIGSASRPSAAVRV
jgi:titin